MSEELSAIAAARAALEVDGVSPAEAAALARAKAGALLDVADMQAIFRIRSIATFFRWQKRGAFDPFRVAFPAGMARFSGVLVWRYLEGLRVPESGRVYFGQKGRR
jgi:hypothetical protein